MRLDFLTNLWKKYRFALLIALVGVVLLLLPAGGKSGGSQEQAAQGSTVEFSLEETEKRMESILGQIDGVGKLQVMLTLSAGSRIQLASNVDTTGSGDGRSRQETVTLNRGSGYQEVIVTRQYYPVYRGAVIVCQGAGNAAVRLALTEAVSALTGLSADKITIVKWKQS